MSRRMSASTWGRWSRALSWGATRRCVRWLRLNRSLPGKKGKPLSRNFNRWLRFNRSPRKKPHYGRKATTTKSCSTTAPSTNGRPTSTTTPAAWPSARRTPSISACASAWRLRGRRMPPSATASSCSGRRRCRCSSRVASRPSRCRPRWRSTCPWRGRGPCWCRRPSRRASKP